MAENMMDAMKNTPEDGEWNPTKKCDERGYHVFGSKQLPWRWWLLITAVLFLGVILIGVIGSPASGSQ